MNLFQQLSAFFAQLFQALESSSWEAERRRQGAFLSQATSVQELEHLQRQWDRRGSRQAWLY